MGLEAARGEADYDYDWGEGSDFDWGRLDIGWSEGGDIMHADGTVLHTVGAA